MSITLRTLTGDSLTGEITPAGDKSISHRTIILGSLAEGTTRATGLLEGEDVLRTIGAFRAMGAEIVRQGPGQYEITGQGVDGLKEPGDVLDMGNSGTAMRLLSGLLASQPFYSVLTGDHSLRSRPMGRVVTPLRKMGARITGRDGGRLAPLTIEGGELVPITYESPVASAQVKSCVLLAGLNTAGETTVIEPAPTRDHTERMLTAFGAEVERDGLKVTVDGWPELKAQSIEVPADISAAAFPMVAALITPGSDIIIRNVGMNPTRTGILALLDLMGANIERINERNAGGEPVADLHVRYSELRGIDAPREVAPAAIDEYPIFFVAAALADGVTEARGIEELRVKESDRISAMAKGLTALGAEFTEYPDGARIVGNPNGLKGGATVDSDTDHRIAMSLLVAGLRCAEPVTVTRCDNINTSFPGFATSMGALGMRVEEVAEPQS
ncbi:3-phosphoshikimate 1-carboxyvinyltransferase [Magnetofaba australis]|uniref:3-phosphoshikimate 1-carboxyvinyltransferase n=1 Tax=Magnetofaba australis IT-1 TaxID=1434232 RepID=A0A1Y2K7D6_9PROT|nr:3-phosphoshikimate 1-carboxyvinyltransferase [Magnetofaba australis]OSM06237.1 putative 3-phosphoshikimate 1-carboxyvinyltransferase [Magnetofaba australis IT-1]